MKRTLFYAVMVLQVGIISVMGLQYYLIDDIGMTVRVLSVGPNTEKYYPYNYEDQIYLDYEMNTIQNSKWDVSETIYRNEKVYILLEVGNGGIYHAIKASDEKMNAKSNQVVFVGKYQYYDSMSDVNRVEYGIEEVRGDYSNLDQSKQRVITLKVAPWGQKRVVDIVNVVE